MQVTEQIQDSKVYYTYDEIDITCRNISINIKETFNPDLIIAIGGGGLIPARIMRSILNVPIHVLTINYYDSDNNIMENPNIIQWIDPIALKDKRVLIVDEINDTGKTLKYIMSKLDNTFKELGVMVIHDKIKDKVELNIENYFVGQYIEDKWVVYPWE